MYTAPTNQGVTIIEQKADKKGFQTANTILMSDLLPLITFKRAVMKIDIEGYEHFAFASSEPLFDAIDIPLVCMEWFHVKKRAGNKASEEDRSMFAHMMKVLSDRQYVACSCVETYSPLPVNGKWPYNICWRKKQTPPNGDNTHSVAMTPV